MTNNTEEKKESTLNDVTSLLQQNQETLNELLTWIKIENIDKVKNILNSVLDTAEKKIVYHHSDGSSLQDIKSKSGVDDSVISKLHRKWFKLGLMKKVGARGRGDKHVRIFDLEAFNIEIPTIELKQSQTQPVNNEQSTGSVDNL